MRIETEVLISEYQHSLFAAAFNICRNVQDAEDAVQDTFLQYHLGKKEFESEQHIRAWLLRVAINRAKNTTLSFWRRNKSTLEDPMDGVSFDDSEEMDLLTAVLSLPEKYRIVVHLFYYEDYPIKEIARILQITESNAKKRLSRGRMILKEKLKEDWNEPS